ncbi:Transglutaminase-like superfamily protein [Streptomyces sp. 2231.1]|uniref:lasso peptide biosynthesis B2 protein n=1 Tax=Streptomyces sp. 2231.1 TaxID=1855347 RepID=UPI00089AF3D5|nr:lasso peptide biosynthesis B2 protein [Streptomyces sp. 2231.1]SEB97958.1 Transglutaminase-like superfamily protein [Streptomyces sp. 2231.1]
MADHTEALVAVRRFLSPSCRVVQMSGGALIADFRRARFLGMTTADVQKFVDGSAEERAELAIALVRSGCAPAHRKEYADAEIRLWLRGVRLLIRTVGFGRVLRFLSLAAPDYVRAEAPGTEDVARLKRAVQSLAHTSWFVNDDCKAEAVTAFVLLRRSGLQAVLHVGMREHPFALHAWTSAAGLCIPDADPRGHAFAPILSIDRGGR